MSNALISIIVPCYNVDQFLDKSLKSIESQLYKNWECILVNDGSKDNTESIALNWTKKNSRFKYVYQDNQGLSGARNTGIKNATGEFIYFFDSDDLLDPKTLSSLYELVTNETDIIFGLNAVTEGQNDVVKDLMNHNPETLVLHKNNNKNLLNLVINKPLICVAWNRLYRKSFLDKNNLTFKEGLLHEDELWFFETLFFSNGIILNQTPTYYYNVANTNSITNNFKLKNLEAYLTIITYIYNNYYLKFPEAQNTISSYITYLQYLTIVHAYNQIKTKEQAIANTKIKATFKQIIFNNFNPNLNQETNKTFKEFYSINHLDADDLLKFFKYSRSKKITRQLKKKLLLLKSKKRD